MDSRRTPPVAVLSGWSLLAAGVLVVVFFLVVRAEPRPELAASALVVAGVGLATLLRVPFAAVLSVPLGLFLLLFPALRKYYSFSLERPEEVGGLAFTLVALAIAGIVLTSGGLAVWAALRSVEWSRGRSAVASALLGGLAVGVAAAVVLDSQAQPDQAGELLDEQVAALPAVVMDDFRFVPDRLTARAGTESVIRVVNDDVETYRFTVDLLGLDVIVPSGRTAVVRFTPTRTGTLEFYSGEEGGEHRDLGMVGEIIVTQ